MCFETPSHQDLDLSFPLSCLLSPLYCLWLGLRSEDTFVLEQKILENGVVLHMHPPDPRMLLVETNTHSQATVTSRYSMTAFLGARARHLISRWLLFGPSERRLSHNSRKGKVATALGPQAGRRPLALGNRMFSVLEGELFPAELLSGCYIKGKGEA